MAGDDDRQRTGPGGSGAAPFGPSPTRSPELGSTPGKPSDDRRPEPLLPAVTLPKGGGALRGIGEKLSINAPLGTASFSIPLATTPGRAGFGPHLTLAYDSGTGNGPFGFGWSLSIPSIARKTDKGIPIYDDAAESDVFILTGAEDLVPVLGEHEVDGVRRRAPPIVRVVDGVSYAVHAYRPRVEGLFARIERWVRVADGDTFWRSIAPDNVTSVYGRTPASRITDSADPRRVFRWLLSETYDDRGNAIAYDYKAEDGAGVDTGAPHEARRTAAQRSANRYIKRVRYGNRVSGLVDPDPGAAGWLFEVVFDYGEHAGATPTSAETQPWPARADPFSTYRSAFEVRTYRLCRRVLMFHHFPDEPAVGPELLVRASELGYRETPVASFLVAITQTGYNPRAGGSAVRRSTPTLELAYSEARLHEKIRDVDPQSVENLPQGMDGARYQLVDLDGEGIPGILVEDRGAWYYKANLGDARFGPLQQLPSRPALAAQQGRGQLIDLGGDGNLDFVSFMGPVSGFYERTPDRQWQPLAQFRSLPNIRWDDPNLRFVDLDGDGLPDVMVSENDAFTWYPSRGKEGFGSPQRVFTARDEDRGPRLVFADGTDSIYLADMSGDGLVDLVRIRNGEICYWPSLGHGRFGAKVVMDGAPRFDKPEAFDQRRVRLADVDGTGATDVIYFRRDGLDVYFNQSGNGWAARQTIGGFPHVDASTFVTTADLLGTGTACVVWASPLPGDARRPLKFIDLMGGEKAHLLVSARNNLGAETRLQYAPSTRFYLADKAAGHPWITRLPFPVQVIERMETFDRVSRSRFASRYSYHHGFFDGVEREFRGFARVEQQDTEELSALTAGHGLPPGDNVDGRSHAPPVLTKSWFHTGVFFGGERVSRQLAHEYFEPPGLSEVERNEQLLPDTILPPDLDAESARQAARALRGRILHEEVYALDRSPRSGLPYSVSERDYVVRTEQPLGENHFGVFFVHPREQIDDHFERNPEAPRREHAVTLRVDDFGNVLESAAVGYGRIARDPALAPADQASQAQTLITFSSNSFTNAVDEPDTHHVPQAAESRTFELTGLELRRRRARFSPAGLLLAFRSASAISFEETPTPGQLEKRLIDQRRTLYRRDDLDGALPLGRQESRGLRFETYRRAFSDDLLREVFEARVTPARLADGGGYVRVPDDPAGWWMPSGRTFFSPRADDGAAAELAEARRHFFLAVRAVDPFGATTRLSYDRYDLLAVDAVDAVGNRSTVGERDSAGNVVSNGNDYRVLAPRLLMEANRNRTEVAFDALGMLAGTAVMGKPEEELGDSLEGFEPDLPEAVVLAHLAAPTENPAAILGDATTRILYDLDAFVRTRDDPEPQPVVGYTARRETHVSALAPGEQSRIQNHLAYSDGFGRVLQTKSQAEPGPVASGSKEIVSPRWVGSGWTIFDNKGRAVQVFEPFFSASHRFERAFQVGVGSIAFYDPLGRVVGKLHPNHTFEKVAFDPWAQTTSDTNDTVLVTDPAADPDVGDFFRRLPPGDYLPTWFTERQRPRTPPAERKAADKAAVHANTPTVARFDGLGRPFLTIAHNRFQRASDASATDQLLETRVRRDVQDNLLETIDARGRLVARSRYDMTGRRLRHLNMDAGERLLLPDVLGNPIDEFESRGFHHRTDYDPARRAVTVHLDRGAGTPETLVERTVYGEQQADAESLNLRGRVFQTFDGAGTVIVERYDFHGNLERSVRRLLADYRITPDWSAGPALEGESFSSTTRHDALDRPIQMIAPHSDREGTKISVIEPAFNEANLLERLYVWLDRDVEPDAVLAVDTATFTAVTNLDYNARGQRLAIRYGNGAGTKYRYDPLTFRLQRLVSRRPGATEGAAPDKLQDLRYTYDPSGNVTRIADRAQQALFFRNDVVRASADYAYDAIYRLIEATGREHLGQTASGTPEAPVPPDFQDGPRVGLLQPGDSHAMGRYVERYVYDEVGNFLEMAHRGSNPAQPGWSRRYSYTEASAVAPGTESNRLSQTEVGQQGAEVYRYDESGNMTAMPQLSRMEWNHEDQLQIAAQQVVAAQGAAPETTFYVYGTGGKRVRKVTERQAAPGAAPVRKSERIYLGGFEIFRELGADGATVTLERETLHVMDGTRRAALIETRTAGDDGSPARVVRYVFDNHLQSSVIELDAAAQIISYEEYYPFGGTAYQAGRSVTEVRLKRYRYTGKERDDETGLYAIGARYYASWLGRWTSCDPAGTGGDGVNLYAYAKNDPIGASDPSGLLSWRSIAIIAAVVVVSVAVTVVTAGVAGPLIAGAVASGAAAVGASATTAAVVTGVAVGAAAGAAGGFAGEITRQAASGEIAEQGGIDFGKVGRATAVGAFGGAVTGGVASGLASTVKAAGTTATALRTARTAAIAETSLPRTAAQVAGTVAKGAGLGALASGSGELFGQAVFDRKIDPGRLFDATISGAAIGGAVSLTVPVTGSLEASSTRLGVGLARGLYGRSSYAGTEAAFYAVTRGVSLGSPSKAAPGNQVNVDTGSAVALSSEGTTTGAPGTGVTATATRADVEALVGGRDLVITRAAAREFQGTMRSAGPTERANVSNLLDRLTVIPANDPVGFPASRRVGPVDRIVFGTGVRAGTPTLTTDANPGQLFGPLVTPAPIVHQPIPFTGQ